MHIQQNTVTGYRGTAACVTTDTNNTSTVIILAADFDDLVAVAKKLGIKKLKFEKCRESIIVAASNLPALNPRLEFYRPPIGEGSKQGQAHNPKPKKS